MNFLKKITTIIFIIFLVWCILSYLNILANNTNLDGTSAEFAKWNLFTILLNR